MMMVVLKSFLLVAGSALLIYLGATAVYLFIFALAGVLRPLKKRGSGKNARKIAVMIPGYREDVVILDTARQARNQDYPRDRYDVYIIADSFQPATLAQLAELDVTVIEVVFEKSSKAKALNQAMRVIPEGYDAAVVLDADNIMAPDFLTQVNEGFDRGFTALQGHRVAKNTNTPMAVLDAISEEINNHIFRMGHRALGFSSALIGSGMAFLYGPYREIMKGVTANGEDKELEMKLLMQNIKTEYLPFALIYDEKTQRTDVFAKQRKRWLSAQFALFGQYCEQGLKQVFTRGNFDLFDKLVQMILPPRVLHIGVVTILLLAGLLEFVLSPADSTLLLPLPWILGMWAITIAALLFSIPGKFYNSTTLKALATLPRTFFIMFGLLFRLRGANRNFIHTTHGTVDAGKKKNPA